MPEKNVANEIGDLPCQRVQNPDVRTTGGGSPCVSWFDVRLGESLEWTKHVKNTFIDFDSIAEERQQNIRRERSAPADSMNMKCSPQNCAIQEVALSNIEYWASVAAMNWAARQPYGRRSRGRSARRSCSNCSSCSGRSCGQRSGLSSRRPGARSGTRRPMLNDRSLSCSSRGLPRAPSICESKRGTPARHHPQPLSRPSSEDSNRVSCASGADGCRSDARSPTICAKACGEGVESVEGQRDRKEAGFSGAKHVNNTCFSISLANRFNAFGGDEVNDSSSESAASNLAEFVADDAVLDVAEQSGDPQHEASLVSEQCRLGGPSSTQVVSPASKRTRRGNQRAAGGTKQKRSAHQRAQPCAPAKKHLMAEEVVECANTARRIQGPNNDKQGNPETSHPHADASREERWKFLEELHKQKVNSRRRAGQQTQATDRDEIDATQESNGPSRCGAGAQLKGARAECMALFTAKLNEGAVVGHLKSLGISRAILATPVDPPRLECPDMLQVQMGGVVSCEATDSENWCFGTTLAPPSLAGQRGCFRRDGMHPVACEMHKLRDSDRLELSGGNWEEVEKLRGSTTSTQDRLRHKALSNRMRATRLKWESLHAAKVAG